MSTCTYHYYGKNPKFQNLLYLLKFEYCAFTIQKSTCNKYYKMQTHRHPVQFSDLSVQNFGNIIVLLFFFSFNCIFSYWMLEDYSKPTINTCEIRYDFFI